MLLIPLFVILPLAGAFLLSLFGKNRKTLCDIFSNCLTLILFLFSLFILFTLNSKLFPIVYKIGGWNPPSGIPFVLDGLSAFMLVIANFLAFMVNIFCVNYMESYTAKSKFYTLFMLVLAGMNGILMSGDIFNLFVFFEIASVASYALVAFGTEAEDFEATFKYMAMGVVGSLFMLLAIAFIYSYTSTLNMADISQVLILKGINRSVIFAAILLLTGLALKSGTVPFHGWLADAYGSTPAPMSALFAGIFTKTLGVFALCRIFYNIIGVSTGFLNILMFLGALSIIIGGLLALGQTDSKRLIAYSSISQIGYITLGLGVGTPLAIFAALFHLFNHSIFKSLLFLNSGALEYATGKRDILSMGGLRNKMPVTANTSLIASMSVSGIPPFAGFFSKLLIISACIQSGHIGYAILAVIGAILTISYFMKFQKYIFFGKLTNTNENVEEVPFLMKIPMITLALICIASSFLILPALREPLLDPAKEVLVKGIQYKDNVVKALYEE